jgi:hypothetical protein
MSEFGVYLELGFKHITDLYGFDHILFIVALCTIYLIKDWKQILVLVTAFTIGHSITLALASLDIVNVDSDLVEFLIPITIMLTAFYNLSIKFKTSNYKKVKNKIWPRYFVAIGFGLIHGLGFSNYLRSLLGKSNSIFSQLLAFNIGLEIGQLLIVIALLIISFLVVNIGGLNRNRWNWVISAIVLGMAFMIAIEKAKSIF